jgi:hypothetical protein
MKKLFQFVKEIFTRDYWIKNVPSEYHEECFMCNKPSCNKSCPFFKVS